MGCLTSGVSFFSSVFWGNAGDGATGVNLGGTVTSEVVDSSSVTVLFCASAFSSSGGAVATLCSSPASSSGSVACFGGSSSSTINLGRDSRGLRGAGLAGSACSAVGEVDLLESLVAATSVVASAGDKLSACIDSCSESPSTSCDFTTLTRRGGPSRGLGGSVAAGCFFVFLFVRRGVDACWNS